MLKLHYRSGKSVNARRYIPIVGIALTAAIALTAFRMSWPLLHNRYEKRLQAEAAKRLSNISYAWQPDAPVSSLDWEHYRTRYLPWMGDKYISVPFAEGMTTRLKQLGLIWIRQGDPEDGHVYVVGAAFDDGGAVGYLGFWYVVLDRTDGRVVTAGWTKDGPRLEVEGPLAPHVRVSSTSGVITIHYDSEQWDFEIVSGEGKLSFRPSLATSASVNMSVPLVPTTNQLYP